MVEHATSPPDAVFRVCADGMRRAILGNLSGNALSITEIGASSDVVYASSKRVTPPTADADPGGKS
ncbi:hypothetical protein [Methylobacterium trifolii]|uniref:Uncharacterized protein n=1 Tax=Methylobacterium trifolii TaxID=1003092 RepID=A0ABQ4U778_9HYPH|nr:hypothetical protein [Methylobacterium trifolii]GJE62228.1 hypothetical protein MPOCJGCO_4359 [Methylobacterium trifolii]